MLITSVNTVKILSQKFSKEELNNIKTYCVGKVTEKYALEAGFNCIKTNSYSGGTLAKNVIKKSTCSNKKILMIGATVLAYDPTEIFRRARNIWMVQLPSHPQRECELFKSIFTSKSFDIMLPHHLLHPIFFSFDNDSSLDSRRASHQKIKNKKAQTTSSPLLRD